jgi:hypothetical protein
MSVIIIKDGLYLNQFYEWGIIPHLFEVWRWRDVVSMMLGTPKKPTGYAMVDGTSIDLDRLEVVRL